MVLARSSNGHPLAEPQDGDPVGDLEDVVQVVGDDHDAEIPFRQALDEVEHLTRLGDAERRGGLVEDDETGVPHHRLRHGDGLSLASREPGDGLPNRFERGDGEAVQRFPRGALHARLVEHETDASPLPPQEHVGDDVEVVGEREILVDDLDAELGCVTRAVDVDVGPVVAHLAFVEWIDADDALDQRRLAGPVVADESHDLAAADLEIDPVERLDGAEGLRDPPKLEERRVSSGHYVGGVWEAPRRLPHSVPVSSISCSLCRSPYRRCRRYRSPRPSGSCPR